MVAGTASAHPLANDRNLLVSPQQPDRKDLYARESRQNLHLQVVARRECLQDEPLRMGWETFGRGYGLQDRC